MFTCVREHLGEEIGQLLERPINIETGLGRNVTVADASTLAAEVRQPRENFIRANRTLGEITLVTDEEHRDARPDRLHLVVEALQVTKGAAPGQVKEDQCCISTDTVTTDPQAVEAFLTSSVPAVEDQRAVVSGEGHRVDLYTHSGCVFRVKRFTTLLPDECSLTGARVTGDEQLDTTRAGHCEEKDCEVGERGYEVDESERVVKKIIIFRLCD